MIEIEHTPKIKGVKGSYCSLWLHETYPVALHKLVMFSGRYRWGGSKSSITGSVKENRVSYVFEMHQCVSLLGPETANFLR